MFIYFAAFIPISYDSSNIHKHIENKFEIVTEILHIPQIQQFLNHNDESLNLINTGILMAMVVHGPVSW